MARFRVPKLSLLDNTYPAVTQSYLLCRDRFTEVTDPKDIAFFRKYPDRFEEEGKPYPPPTPKVKPTVTVDDSDESPPVAPPAKKHEHEHDKK